MEDNRINEYAQFLELKIRPGQPVIEYREKERLITKLAHGWALVNHHHLQKTYKCNHFSEAVDATNVIRTVTEKLHHHVDVSIKVFGELIIDIYTVRLDDLTINDFVLAAHINEALRDYDVPQGYSIR